MSDSPITPEQAAEAYNAGLERDLARAITRVNDSLSKYDFAGAGHGCPVLIGKSRLKEAVRACFEARGWFVHQSSSLDHLIFTTRNEED